MEPGTPEEVTARLGESTTRVGKLATRCLVGAALMVVVIPLVALLRM